MEAREVHLETGKAYTMLYAAHILHPRCRTLLIRDIMSDKLIRNGLKLGLLALSGKNTPSNGLILPWQPETCCLSLL